MTVSEFLKVSWEPVEGPLIEPPLFSPVIADPSFLLPEETPAGSGWSLFAHSAWGIHRYTSPDGRAWRDRGLVVRNAMRPFVRRLAAAGGEGTHPAEPYQLCYEKYPPLALPLTVLPVKRRWRSRLAVSRSGDLSRWSGPATVLEPVLPWMRDPDCGSSVSNPCLVEAGGEWRLYHSASLVWLPDCGFCEPRYLALARGPTPRGPFVPDPEPITDPARTADPGFLGSGSMKVIPLEDGFVGLQNRIYRDSRGASRSAIFLLRSENGIGWRPARPGPLISPGTGWTSSHVYACDCRFRESDGLWYLYFNARDGWRISSGTERIGRIVGRP